MPTYDFRCPNGHVFERRFARISDSPSTTECPTCGAVAERQISGGAGLLFKGSGFYITDYGKDGKKDQRAAAKAASDASSSSSSGGESGSAPKSDSAAAAKPAESKPASSPSTGKSASNE